MFKFNWNFFNVEDLQARCQEAFTESVANTRQPPSIAQPIRATAIDFGSKPPQIIFKEIKSVSLHRTHLIFSLKYSGDASISLATAVHANPLLEPFNETGFFAFTRPKVVAALTPFVLPFAMRISHVVLDTLIHVVYTPNGVVLSFEGQPIKHIEVETSLDMIPMLNSMITNILRLNLEMSFEEDIPESVWTSTSPNHHEPDPFRGARRWSQHLKQFQRFQSSFAPPAGPRIGVIYPSFNTLSLSARAQPFALPCAIANRACLPAYAKKPQGNLGIDRFVESSSVRSASSTSSTFRPRRRVISLRRREAEAANPQLKSKANANANANANAKTKTKTPPGTPGPGTPGPGTPSPPQSPSTSQKVPKSPREIDSSNVSPKIPESPQIIIPNPPPVPPSPSLSSMQDYDLLVPQSIEHHRSFSSPKVIRRGSIRRNIDMRRFASTNDLIGLGRRESVGGEPEVP